MVNSQSEYNTILNACTTAESSSQGCCFPVKITFPMTILTIILLVFNKTGSVVITSQQQYIRICQQ
jgi:hypothetical protein